MQREEIEEIEISILLEAIVQRYGYDFRNYIADSIARRIALFRQQKGFSSIAEMIPRILHDPVFFQELQQSLSVTVTEMFRDPFVYLSIRKNVVSLLQTYPSIRIWVAGCATGEEAYSLAILLKEEGLLDKTTIFATDINDEALRLGKDGIYREDNIKLFTGNYRASGGTRSFSAYYRTDDGAATIDQSLKSKITFAKHNLATDGVFTDMHLIMCRNVLIYFDRTLQNRVLQLFEDSLVYGGYLCLGTKEILRFSSVADSFNIVDNNARIYRKHGKKSSEEKFSNIETVKK